jgi:hypothetical protein
MSETISPEASASAADAPGIAETVAGDAEATPGKPAESEAPPKQNTERPPVPGADALHLFFDPPGTLRLTIGDGWESYSYGAVRLYQAAPLSMPGRYLSLQDSKNEEIFLVDRLDDLNPESRAVAEEEIHRRYLTARVDAVTNIKTEFGITYWNVRTDRGERDFVVQSLSESCVWLSDTHILLIDVDGNRFEIPDRTRLDSVSQQNLATVL